MESEDEMNVFAEAFCKLLQFDFFTTFSIVSKADDITILRKLKSNAKALELSCHGIPWLAFWIAFTWLFDNPPLVEMQANMLMGLFLDILFVAVAKAYFRRPRPFKNTDDMLGQIGPDVFSLPSGHASRSVFVAYFFMRLWPLHIVFQLVVLIWTAAICVSRILMRRHYLMDVVAGCFLGLFEGVLIGFFWLSGDTARSLLSMITDEKLEGGEYHV